MAYDFLGLVNEVNRRLNEVELTSSNFAAAKGFYSQAKDAVNSAIQDINQTQFEWPFNYVKREETLVAGTTRYAYPASTKTVDYDTFRIKWDDTLGVGTQKLQILAYEEYLENYVDQEYNTDTSLRGIPKMVFRAPNLEYGLVPAPDQAYTLVYEYYTHDTALSAYDDAPTIPEAFRHVIIDGAMYYAYMFRGNTQDAAVSKDKFEKGVKNMRTLLINRYDYVRSTALIQNNRRTSFAFRVA
jgi:hypothetical protein